MSSKLPTTVSRSSCDPRDSYRKTMARQRTMFDWMLGLAFGIFLVMVAYIYVQYYICTSCTSIRWLVPHTLILPLFAFWAYFRYTERGSWEQAASLLASGILVVGLALVVIALYFQTGLTIGDVDYNGKLWQYIFTWVILVCMVAMIIPYVGYMNSNRVNVVHSRADSRVISVGIDNGLNLSDDAFDGPKQQ